MNTALTVIPSPIMPARGVKDITLGDAIAALHVAKSSANYRPLYVKGLRSYLNLFARGREQLPLRTFTVETIEEWFASRNDAKSTQISDTGRLSALFAFGVRREWIEKNPCRLMEKPRIEHKPPRILTVLQAALILDWCKRRKPNQLAFFTLALFAGVRPEELSRLTWQSINLEDGIVTIDAAASKVHRRRIITLEPTALAWLKLAHEHRALLPVTRITRRRYLDHVQKVLGIEGGWPQDCLRHTAASFLMAKHADAGKVADGLGNSARILLRNYRNLVTRADCEAFWSFLPDSPRPVRPEPPKPVQEAPAPVLLPGVWGLAIDMALPRFRRAELALTIEPTLRALARQKQRDAGHRGGLTGQCCASDRIDTIGEVGRVSGCSRQLVQWVRVLLNRSDWDTLEKLRLGKLSVAGTYRRLMADALGNTASTA